MKGGVEQCGAELPTLGNVEQLQEHWRRSICGDDKCHLSIQGSATPWDSFVIPTCGSWVWEGGKEGGKKKGNS